MDCVETSEKQGQNGDEVSVCTKVCTKCCRLLTILDNPYDIIRMTLLGMIGGSNDHTKSDQRPENQPRRSEKALLTVIRLISEMDLNERAILIKLLKVLDDE